MAYIFRKEGPPDDVYQSDFDDDDDDEFGYWNESPHIEDNQPDTFENKEEIKIKYHFKPQPQNEKDNL